MALTQLTRVSTHASRRPSTSAPTMDLLATTVHELRSPLTTISGQVQLARRFVARDEARERDALNLALAQVARMDRLLDELADLSAAAAGDLSLAYVPFDLRDAVGEAVARHETDDQSRFAVGLSDERVEVNGDAQKIGRVLDNLLDNAVKYSPADSRIEVTLAVVGTDAEVRVVDHGMGIPSDALDHLFSAYFRSSRTRNLPGTGLGLHISRRVAEQHGGALWLEATTEAGSTFVLSLPRAS